MKESDAPPAFAGGLGPPGLVRILVCDRDAVVRRVVREHLGQEGFEVATFDSPEQCLASALADAPGGIVLGLRGSELELEYLGLLRAQGIDSPIVALVPGPATATGVLAEQAGASAVVPKPLHRAGLEAIAIELRQGLAALRFQDEREHLRSLEARRERLVLGEATALGDALAEVAKRVETAHAFVVIGETGTGKRHAVRAIHDRTAHRGGPLLSIDARSQDADSIEAAIFGGAKRGLLEVASGGTLHVAGLQHVPPVRERLMTTLREGRLQRLKDTTSRPLLATLAVSTTEPLPLEPDSPLATAPVLTLPALRDRRADIPELVEHFLAELRPHLAHHLKGLSAAAKSLMLQYRWPGNVRELRSVVGRIASIYKGAREVLPEHLPSEIRQPPAWLLA